MSGFNLFLFVLIYLNIRQDKLENAKYIRKYPDKQAEQERSNSDLKMTQID